MEILELLEEICNAKENDIPANLQIIETLDHDMKINKKELNGKQWKHLSSEGVKEREIVVLTDSLNGCKWIRQGPHNNYLCTYHKRTGEQKQNVRILYVSVDTQSCGHQWK